MEHAGSGRQLQIGLNQVSQGTTIGGRSDLRVGPEPATRSAGRAVHAGWPARAVRLSSARMSVHDGNGWTRCGLGHRHWGRFGAAGLLIGAGGGGSADIAGGVVLLHERNHWVSYGGTWGPPGGARDSHESIVNAALREAREECGIAPESVTVNGVFSDDHGGWAYQTVLATAPVPFAVVADRDEAADVAWVRVTEVEGLRLHPGFAEQWPVLREALPPLTLIVDGANVIGSRPDGWWRDRGGAAMRLRDQLAALAARGIGELPESAGGPELERWFPRILLVVEGAAARAAAGWEPDGGAAAGAGGGVKGDGVTGGSGGRLRVVRAPGSGDDEIAALAARLSGRRLVITADRELRERCLAAGASVAGPRWLLGLLGDGDGDGDGHVSQPTAP